MSVRELTRRLDVSHNLVHHHFGSKQELWRAALDHGVGPTVSGLLELIGASVGGPNPAETLREGMERAMGTLLERPAVARILSDEAARPGPRLDFLYERYLRPGVELLQRFLSEARNDGVRDVDSRMAVVFVLSAASSLFTHGALAEKLGLDASSLGEHSATLIELALGGLAPASFPSA